MGVERVYDDKPQSYIVYVTSVSKHRVRATSGVEAKDIAVRRVRVRLRVEDQEPFIPKVLVVEDRLTDEELQQIVEQMESDRERMKGEGGA